jgi:DNA-binding NtrC family response regulator
MSKLWIVHRNPQSRTALARISGRAASEIVTGAPIETDFADRPKPAAVVLGLEGDFERELEFVHRLRSRLDGCQWVLLAAPEDAAEAARLFEISGSEILDSLPTPRVLRARIASAFARRRAESLTQRRVRERVAGRFSAWFGGLDIPGLLRALDPSLRHLPLLVRGVPGSGRTLLARYVELFRTSDRAESGSIPEGNPATQGTSLRIHSNDVGDIGDLARRIAMIRDSGGSTAASVWIDEVDTLRESAQLALAEWIVHETPPDATALESLHWIATAGPSGWQDPLEPALERAFAPLIIEIPALGEDPDALPTFAHRIAREWGRSVGGPERHLSTPALAELALHPWQGDRAEVEAVLRASFASTGRDPIEAADLRFEVARAEDTTAAELPSESQPLDLPVVEAIADDEAPLLEIEELESIDEAPQSLAPDTPAPQPSPSPNRNGSATTSKRPRLLPPTSTKALRSAKPPSDSRVPRKSPKSPSAPRPQSSTRPGGGSPAASRTKSAIPWSRFEPSQSCCPSTTRTKRFVHVLQSSSAAMSRISTMSSHACRTRQSGIPRRSKRSTYRR